MPDLRPPAAILLTAVLALLLHWTLGWAWTVGAGIAGGGLARHYGVGVGAAGVALEWAANVIYSLAVAAAPTRLLLDVLSGLLGNIPDALVVAVTILIGALLGLAGGAVGAQARALIDPPRGGSASPAAAA